ncbi:MAG TPA: hypothetical protein VET69_09190 [Terriglobales bacterium]|nr:hypothetical protein [Terriglobales bacterium]
MAQKLRRCILGTAIVLLALGGVGRAQEQSLAEVAKQKSGKPASRVITNEDLETARPPAASAPSPMANAEPSTPGEKDSGARITVPGLLEQATLSQARATLESLKHDEQVLLRRYAQVQEKLTSGTDEHLRRLYSDSLARRDQTLGRKRAQIEQVEKAIAAAESGRAPSPGSKHEETKLQK